MSTIDWRAFDVAQLTGELRRGLGPREQSQLQWAFEEAIEVARTDTELLGFLLVAVVLLLARLHETTPRSVLETFFRRSITDEEWREKVLPLLP